MLKTVDSAARDLAGKLTRIRDQRSLLVKNGFFHHRVFYRDTWLDERYPLGGTVRSELKARTAQGEAVHQLLEAARNVTVTGVREEMMAEAVGPSFTVNPTAAAELEAMIGAAASPVIDWAHARRGARAHGETGGRLVGGAGSACSRA
jgi:hypothetical protein